MKVNFKCNTIYITGLTLRTMYVLYNFEIYLFYRSLYVILLNIVNYVVHLMNLIVTFTYDY